MKKITMILIAAVVLALFAGAASANTGVGGDRGVIQIACDVEGATAVLVSINGDESNPQTVTNGQAEFSVYTTGTPYKEVKVSAAGYQTATVPVTMPASGKTSVIDVPLTPNPTPTKSPMGIAVLGVLGVIAAVVLIRRD